MSEATIKITDAEHKAVRVPRMLLEVGDVVFDVFGGQHELVRVRHFKNTTRAKRADGEWFSLPYASTITVVRRKEAEAR